MRALFFSILGYFLSPIGIVLMGVLDASMVFFLPLGIDFVDHHGREEAGSFGVPLLATLGSLIGAAGTFLDWPQGGEKGRRDVSAGRLKRVKSRADRGAFVWRDGLTPPPFPFTPFVLASALGMKPWSFLGALAVVGGAPLQVEGALAVIRPHPA